MARKCRKRRYRDKIAADIVIARIQHKDNAKREKSEGRSYSCNACRGWHITSKPLMEVSA